MNNVMDKRIVPSTRRVNHRWHDGGLEAHKGPFMMNAQCFQSRPCTLLLRLPIGTKHSIRSAGK